MQRSVKIVSQSIDYFSSFADINIRKMHFYEYKGRFYLVQNSFIIAKFDL